MRIVKVKVLDGPNIWSIRRTQLIEMLVDIGAYEERPTNIIDGFYERLIEVMPSLYTHRCSEGVEGGFFIRVKDGTWLGHVMEHIALELQTLADMDVGFGRTRQSDKPGVYHVVYSCADAEAGIYAGKAAIEVITAIINNQSVDLNEHLQQLGTIWRRNKLGPSTASIVAEAAARGIPWRRIDDSLIQFGYGKKQKRIEATIAGTTSNIAVELAQNKQRTKLMLSRALLPVPEGNVIADESELNEAIAEIGFPLVLKPLEGNHGRGATTNIMRYEEAVAAFHRAQEISKEVICEKFFTGHDFRALVVNYRFIAAARRTPATVIGDGLHTVRELIQITNNHVFRGHGHENLLTAIQVDEATISLLEKSGCDLDTIPREGHQILLKATANLSTGGTAEDVTDDVHPANRSLFERTARVLGLDICGIDVIAGNLSTPIGSAGGAILEVNAAPGFRMHLQPSAGRARNVAKPVVDMLFPGDETSRIPIVAVTGTNGKTTTTRLIAHIAKTAGLYAGYTTTDGIYIGNDLLEKGDCSGPSSARVVLADPAVEFAVLECARGGILRSGLGFDACNVAVVTNIAADHLGLQGINSLAQLARVKSVVPESVATDGTAVLNADDDLVYNMRENLSCKVALFSLHADNKRIKEHCAKGGLAAVYANDAIYILDGRKKYKLDDVQNIPCTFNGAAAFNIANTLAAVLAGIAENIPLRTIQLGLRSFTPGPENTPGRLNLFEFAHFKLVLDYAHNPHGMLAVAEYISHVPCSMRLGIIAGVGDRRDEDIISLAEEAAKIFDEIVVRLDNDLRGRTAEEMNRLIGMGIMKVNPAIPVHYRAGEEEALDFAIERAVENCLLVFFADNVWPAIEMVQKRLKPDVNSLQQARLAV